MHDVGSGELLGGEVPRRDREEVSVEAKGKCGSKEGKTLAGKKGCEEEQESFLGGYVRVGVGP